MFIAAKAAKADDFKVSLSKEDLIKILQAIHSAKDLNEEKKQLIKELIEIVRYSIPHLSKLKSNENYNQLTSLYKGMNIDSYGNIKTSDIENSIYLAKNS
jgi:dimeric dUTPase (all-alpha-NTP-PPase superfamily)